MEDVCGLPTQLSIGQDSLKSIRARHTMTAQRHDFSCRCGTGDRNGDRPKQWLAVDRIFFHFLGFFAFAERSGVSTVGKHLLLDFLGNVWVFDQEITSFFFPLP